MKSFAGILLAAGTLMAAQDNTFLLRNATVYPVSGPKIENATITPTRITAVAVPRRHPRRASRLTPGSIASERNNETSSNTNNP